VSLELGVAIAAVAVSAIALVATFGAWRMVRSLRRDQQAILGGSTADVVDFAVSLQGRIDDLHGSVDEIAGGLGRVDRRVDDAGGVGLLVDDQAPDALQEALRADVLIASDGPRLRRQHLQDASPGRLGSCGESVGHTQYVSHH